VGAGEATDEVADAADPIDLVAEGREGVFDAGDRALVVELGEAVAWHLRRQLVRRPEVEGQPDTEGGGGHSSLSSRLALAR
jgi:hypothetical protein